MKLFVWRWLVVSSFVHTAFLAVAETRPQYGGVLHIAARDAISSPDPAMAAQPASLTEANLYALIFENLVTVEERGRVQPVLAISWQASHDDRRWQFRLRSGVKFHDGIGLTAEIAATSLRTANSSWHVTAEADTVTIDLESGNPDLLAELALPRNAILNRGTNGPPSGTGPFRIVDWQDGKRLSLAANDDYWGGRPFLDSIEVRTGQTFRDQLMAFQSGKADLIEVAPEQAQRVPVDRQALHSSLPIELLALVFSHDAQSPDEKVLRRVLALSIDRASIGSVLLQSAGQSAGGLLPNWMTGYAFVFSSEADLAQARHLHDQVPTVPAWTLGYDAADPLSRLIAERIVLNAKDAGLSLQVTVSANPNLSLTRIPFDSSDPWVALQRLGAFAGLSVPVMPDNSVENLYAAEQSLLATERIIPLFHLPIVYAISPAVKSWKSHEDGAWSLADTWLENKP